MCQLEPAVTEGDPALWHQLTMNLITSVARHTTDDGSIKIETCHDGEHARLAVSNSGPIVDPDRITALRDPFVQGSSTQQGHGIGLAIVDAIANAHRTAMDITARPEGGLAVTASAPQRE